MVSTLSVKDCDKMLDRQRQGHDESDRRKDAALAKERTRSWRLTFAIVSLLGSVLGAKIWLGHV